MFPCHRIVLLAALAGCAYVPKNPRDDSPAARAPLGTAPEALRSIAIFVDPQVNVAGDAEDAREWASQFPEAITKKLRAAQLQLAVDPARADLRVRVSVRVEQYLIKISEEVFDLSASLALESDGVVQDTIEILGQPDDVEPERALEVATTRLVNGLIASPKLPALADAARAKKAALAAAPITIPAPAEERPAVAAKRPVVAVFDVEDATRKEDPATLSQLTDYLAAQLISVAGFRVVPREQLRAQLTGEKKAGYAACFDESCQIELGKAVSAEKSLATKLVRIGNSCAITATLYDLRTETSERAGSVDTNCSADALLGAVRQLAKQLTSP